MPEPTTDRAPAPAGELSYRVYSLADLDAKLGPSASLRRTRHSTISPYVVSVTPRADGSSSAHEVADRSPRAKRWWSLAAHVAAGAAAAMLVLGSFLLLGDATDDLGPVRTARAEGALSTGPAAARTSPPPTTPASRPDEAAALSPPPTSPHPPIRRSATLRTPARTMEREIFVP